MKKFVSILILNLAYNIPIFSMQRITNFSKTQRLFLCTNRTNIAAQGYLISMLAKHAGTKICPCTRIEEIAVLTWGLNENQLKKVIDKAVEQAKQEQQICKLKDVMPLNVDLFRRAIFAMAHNV